MSKKKNNKSTNKKKKDYQKKKTTVVEIQPEPKKSLSPKIYLIIAGITTLIFLSIYGFRVINPTCTDWIFSGVNSIDIIQHYVGWEAFRISAWTFPLGLTSVLSYPTNISIIFTDSIPLLALLFKIISFALPKTFQYLGLYGLLCFILQGLLSAKIISRYTTSKLNIITVSILFTMIPSMIFRMFYHTALASQWLLILSLETIFLYDEYKEGKKIYYIWALLAFLISTIHIYYLVMCGIILVGYILLDILNTKKVKRSIWLLIIYLSVAALSIWGFGGFTNTAKNDSFGFGEYSYNLNGLFNPMNWSTFLKKLPMIDKQYEGFSYLGLGVILLIIIAIILIIIWYTKDKKIVKQHKNLIISLITISIISTIVAASPKVYLGEHLLFELKLPGFINELWAIFRSTGRFIWPVIHILTLLSIIIILKRLNWKYSLIILAFCTCIQVIDIGNILTTLNMSYTKKYTMDEEYNPYKYDILKKVANNKNIKILVLDNKKFYDDEKMIYADWAINHNITINTFHFARTSFNEILDKNTNKLLTKKDKSKVYIFKTEKECIDNKLKCYELPTEYYLGYVEELK